MTTTSPTPVLSMTGVSKRFAPCRPSRTSSSASTPGRWWPSSGTTARASPPSSRRSPGSTPRTRGTSSSTARPSRSPPPPRRRSTGIATVFQDLALCDNLDVVSNLYLGNEVVRNRALDEVTMEKESVAAAARA